MNDDLKKWLPWIGGAAVLLIIVAVFFLTQSDSEDVAASTTVALVSTTTVADATTTVPATTTTTVPATTTTVPATTTTAPATTTTTVPATTTTTVPATVTFTEEGIYAGDEWVYFGYDDDDTVAAVTAVLGTPTIDSGWVDSDICPPPVMRSVRWDDLLLAFTKAETDFESAGIPQFFMYQYPGPNPTLYTTKGVGVGSTLADLETAYGGPDLVIEESPLVNGEGMWRYKEAPWTGMWGFTTGLDATDTVNWISGGYNCGD